MSLLFCRECNNMMSPRADDARQTLLYVCPHCQYEQDAESACVHDQTYIKSTGAADYHSEKIGAEVTMDPTMPRAPIECAKCQQQEAVYFNPSEENMILRYVCCNPECNFAWDSRKNQQEA